MTRALVWIDEPQFKGWACSYCQWRYPIPTLLRDPDAKRAYDRLAALQFNEHACQAGLPQRHEIEDTSNEPTLTDRVRKLVKVGYKPKDAVQIALDEMAVEHRNHPDVMLRARTEAEDFLRKVREGLI